MGPVRSGTAAGNVRLLISSGADSRVFASRIQLCLVSRCVADGPCRFFSSRVARHLDTAPLLVLSALALLISIGCGESGPELVPVSGQVTVDGEPVESGTVTFYPSSGRPATGELGPGGRYRLTTYNSGDGAVPGHHVVTIYAQDVHGSAPKLQNWSDELSYYDTPRDSSEALLQAAETVWLVPEKYSDRSTSGLTADVNAAQTDYDFTLKFKP